MALTRGQHASQARKLQPEGPRGVAPPHAGGRQSRNWNGEVRLHGPSLQLSPGCLAVTLTSHRSGNLPGHLLPASTCSPSALPSLPCVRASSRRGFRAPDGPRCHRHPMPSGANCRVLIRSFTDASRPTAMALGTWDRSRQRASGRHESRPAVTGAGTGDAGARGPRQDPSHLPDPDHGQSGGGEGSRSWGYGEQIWGDRRGRERSLPERLVTWTPQDGLGEGGGEQTGAALPCTRSPHLSTSHCRLLTRSRADRCGAEGRGPRALPPPSTAVPRSPRGSLGAAF